MPDNQLTSDELALLAIPLIDPPADDEESPPMSTTEMTPEDPAWLPRYGLLDGVVDAPMSDPADLIIGGENEAQEEGGAVEGDEGDGVVIDDGGTDETPVEDVPVDDSVTEEDVVEDDGTEEEVIEGEVAEEDVGEDTDESVEDGGPTMWISDDGTIYAVRGGETEDGSEADSGEEEGTVEGEEGFDDGEIIEEEIVEEGEGDDGSDDSGYSEDGSEGDGTEDGESGDGGTDEEVVFDDDMIFWNVVTDVPTSEDGDPQILYMTASGGGGSPEIFGGGPVAPSTAGADFEFTKADLIRETTAPFAEDGGHYCLP
jgi:hypothetical protein